MRTQIFILLGFVSIVVSSARADLIWNSGHHEFAGGNEGEIRMYNDATADITGGGIGALLSYDTSMLGIYNASTISLLRPSNSSIINIHGGTMVKSAE